MKKNSKKLSKIIAPIALATGCLGVMPATSCGGTYSSVKHIAPYLHEITYDDYTYDSEFVTTKSAEAFGCSSVRRGNFYGRNFDYIFNDTPEFVIRVKENKKKNRHASIGMATHFGLRESKLLNGDYKKQLELVPNITLDGINDAGVICSHNVVSMEPDNVEGEIIKPETQPNNKSAFQLHQLFVPRYVLDNAGSVDEAIDLLSSEDLNIKGDLGGSHHLHIMIADKTKTVVVEFFDKDGVGHFQVVVEEKKEDSTATYGLPIMTNFYVNNGDDDDDYFPNDVKNGVERYEILRDGYSKVNSFADMEELMKKVMFSISYRYVHNVVPYGKKLYDQPEDVEGRKLIEGDLTSEWYSESFKQSEINEVCGSEGSEGCIADLEPITYVFDKLKQDYWITRMMDFRNPPEPKFWQTTHNSTYDMENKHLRIVVQEQYEVYFDYYL